MIESCRSDRCACRRFVGLDHAASALHKPDDPVQCTQWCVLNPQKSAILGCRTFPRRLNSTGFFFEILFKRSCSEAASGVRIDETNLKKKTFW